MCVCCNLYKQKCETINCIHIYIYMHRYYIYIHTNIKVKLLHSMSLTCFYIIGLENDRFESCMNAYWRVSSYLWKLSGLSGSTRYDYGQVWMDPLSTEMGWSLEESLQTLESCSPTSKITPARKKGLNKLNKYNISVMKNNNKNETNQLGQIINSSRWGELQRNTTDKPLGTKFPHRSRENCFEISNLSFWGWDLYGFVVNCRFNKNTTVPYLESPGTDGDFLCEEVTFQNKG